MAADLTRGERLQIMLTRQELEALDSWRFSRRMPSRAAAIRELLKRGLAAEGFDSVEPGSHSKDFGVTGGSNNHPTRARREDGHSLKGLGKPALGNGFGHTNGNGDGHADGLDGDGEA